MYVSSSSIGLSAFSGDAQFNTDSERFDSQCGAGGLDVVFVAGLVNKLNGAFAVEPSIKTPAGLKNKRSASRASAPGI